MTLNYYITCYITYYILLITHDYLIFVGDVLLTHELGISIITHLENPPMGKCGIVTVSLRKPPKMGFFLILLTWSCHSCHMSIYIYIYTGFWNIGIIFHFIYGIIPTPLTNSIIFQDGYCTTNQNINSSIYPMLYPITYSYTMLYPINYTMIINHELIPVLVIS